jgi:formylglycine-generating enzyme required for sulfatase activity
VTNRQYLEYVEAGGRTPDTWPDGHMPSGESFLPVVGVTWADAKGYCEWRGKRLPTESEWELACRGTDGRLYPWGKDWDPRNANTPQSTCGRALTIGTYSPAGDSAYGISDMIGNVSEWTSSILRSYPYQEQQTEPPDEDAYRVIRGGSWQRELKYANCSARDGGPPDAQSEAVGFRCAQSVSAP